VKGGGHVFGYNESVRLILCGYTRLFADIHGSFAEIYDFNADFFAERSRAEAR